MKSPLAVLLATCLVACEYNDITIIDASPVVRETLYYEESGQKIFEKTFDYDGEGHVLREFTNMIDEGFNDSEIVYHYDSQGQLVKKEEGMPGNYFSTEFTYGNGLVYWEISRSIDNNYVISKQYFYSFTLLDSIRTEVYFNNGTISQGSSTERFQYDDQQRLIKRANMEYEYDSRGRVAWSCAGEGGPGVANICLINEYNEYGQLVKVSQTSVGPTSTETRLKEEYTYKSGRLVEKRMYSWYYTRTATDSPAVDLIKYEY